MTICAKEKTIARFLDECFDNEGKYDVEFSLPKVFEMTEDELRAAKVGDEPLCECGGYAWHTSLSDDPPSDPDDSFEEFRFEFTSPNVPPVRAAKKIAERYQCGVVLNYDEPNCMVHGSFACHYDKETDSVKVDFQYDRPENPDYESMNLPG
jgi:hypothetical protein